MPPAFPSVAAFNVASQPETARSPVRPLTSSILPISQQLMMEALAPDSGRVATFRADSRRAAELSKKEMDKIFKYIQIEDRDGIITSFLPENSLFSRNILFSPGIHYARIFQSKVSI